MEQNTISLDRRGQKTEVRKQIVNQHFLWNLLPLALNHFTKTHATK